MASFKKLKGLYHKLIHSHATPEEVAQGFALGIFISLTPTIGIQTLLAIGMAALLKKNEIAAIVGVWLTNPLTFLPIYFFTYRLGHLFLGEVSPKPLKPEGIVDFFHIGGDLLIPLWLGGFTVGIVAAVISYYMARWFYPYLKKKSAVLKHKIEEKLHH